MDTKAKAVLPGTALGSHSADYSRTNYHLNLDPIFTRDDVLRPGFWAHHARTLRRGDLVDVLSVDERIDLQLRVVEAGIGFVKMRLLREWSSEAPEMAADEEPAADIPDGYTVNFAPKHRWRVLMKGFADPISINHATKADAVAAAWAHSQKANAA